MAATMSAAAEDYYRHELRRRGRPGPLRSFVEALRDDGPPLQVRREDRLPEYGLPPGAAGRAYRPDAPFPAAWGDANLFVLRHPATRHRYLVDLDPATRVPAWVAACAWLPSKRPRPDTPAAEAALAAVPRAPGRAAPLSELARRGWDADALFRFHWEREPPRADGATLDDALAWRADACRALVRLGVPAAEVATRLNAVVVRHLPCA